MSRDAAVVMNEITARFAAMAERAAAAEQGGPLFRRRAGESEQSALDRAVQEELDSLAVESQQPPSVAARSGPHQGRAFSSGPASEHPPAIDPHDGPLSPKTNDARGRAVTYVARLIESYRGMRRDSYSYKVGLTGKIGHLAKELALMQSAGPEGETLARRWDFIVGDGQGGQYGAMSLA